MSQYETANITYKGLEDKGLTYTLIDENKGKWTIWKKDYKDKTKDSDAWATLQTFRMGDSFGVSYQEKEESFVGKDGKTVKFKRKTIYSILPIITNPTNEMKTSKPMPDNEQIPLPSENGGGGNNYKSMDQVASTPIGQDKFGRRLALHGFVNARLQNHTIQQVKLELDELLALEDYLNEKL